MTVKAIYENGVFRPTEPVDLADRTEVRVLIPSPPRSDGSDPTGLRTAEQLIGCIEDAPEDGADQHDRYIYDLER